MMLLRLNHPLGLSSETGHAPNHLNEELHSCTMLHTHSGSFRVHHWYLFLDFEIKKKLAEKLGTSHYGVMTPLVVTSMRNWSSCPFAVKMRRFLRHLMWKIVESYRASNG